MTDHVCLSLRRVYEAIVRPLMEYVCVVWLPHTVKDVNMLEAAQRRAA